VERAGGAAGADPPHPGRCVGAADDPRAERVRRGPDGHGYTPSIQQ